MFKSDYPNRIYLDDTVAQEFEKDHALPAARRFVEATILHELVHWANSWSDEFALFTVTPSGWSVDSHAPERFKRKPTDASSACGRQ